MIEDMYAQWVDKGVDLDQLVLSIRAFFEKRGFEIEETHDGEQRILAALIRRTFKVVRIVVEGKPDDFAVEGLFVADKDRPPSEILSSMFGGGAFLLNDLRWRETLLALEKDFSVYIDRVVTDLTNSVGSVRS